MGGAEEELEDHLLDVGNRILTPPSSADQLLSLLDQAETFLSRVEQSPSQSMLTALSPAMSGLSAKELLGHPDTDVKVAVASCISEITRITAPEAPYDDELMQVVFQMIVEAFRKLDDMSSRSYSKRVSILETVAKVRSCVVMLDLECDSLILEMFNHFLNTIRDTHPENVFSSMELIMTLVLEESEDISPELLSCLLLSLKKNNKDILPISRKLAENVIGNCASKLKPYLTEAVHTMDASLSDFSKIVSSVCHESSDGLEQNGVNVSSECLAGESKISERALSNEMPQGSQKVESEVACPEVSAEAAMLPRSLVSNGLVHTGSENSLMKPTSANKKTKLSRHTVIPKNATAARLEVDVLDTDHSTKESEYQKRNSAVQPTEKTDHSQAEAVKLPNNRKKGRGRRSITLQSGGVAEKESEVAGMEDNEKRTGYPSEKPSSYSASIVSPSHSENLPDSTRPKRGRPSGSKVPIKKVETSTSNDVPVSPSGSKNRPVNGSIEDETVPSMDIGVKKQIEGISVLDKKPLRHSVKRRHLENVDDGGKASTNTQSELVRDLMSDPEGKLHGRPGRKSRTKKASEGETSGEHRTVKTKQKDKASSENMVVDEPNQKEDLTMKSRKKRAREEISETPHNAIKYDESLLGFKIKVWWPDDEEFYPGVVDSYDPTTMKHKVLYDDGDVEELMLKDETFEFLKGDKQEEKNDSTPETAEMPQEEAKKLDSSVKKSKVVSSSKSGGSAGKVSADGIKSGRKRGVNSSESTDGRRGSSKTGDDSTPTGSMSKKKGKTNNVDTPKGSMPSEDDSDSKPKDGSSRATTKASDTVSKSGRKSKGDTPKTASGSKDDASKTSSAKNQATKRGSKKANNDVAGTSSKLRQKIISPGKSRSKLDANGSAKGKTGSSKQLEAEDVAAKINSDSRVSQESEERSGKKRRKKSQS